MIKSLFGLQVREERSERHWTSWTQQLCYKAAKVKSGVWRWNQSSCNHVWSQRFRLVMLITWSCMN